MTRQVAPLTCDLLSTLPEVARQCAYWELDPVRRGQRSTPDDRSAAKQQWLSDTLLEWGSCGQVVLVDGRPAAFALYAPASFVPSSNALATAPVSADAVLITTGEVFADRRGSGLGRLLVQAVVKDVARRRIRAVEAFATHRPRTCTADPTEPCLLPAAFLAAVGFTTSRPHAFTPRMRLDIRSVAMLRTEVETAVDRMLAGLWPAARAN